MTGTDNLVIELELDPAQLEQVLGAHAETGRELIELRAEVARLSTELALLSVQVNTLQTQLNIPWREWRA